jgi:fluoroacetyl-CoA thioesterase
MEGIQPGLIGEAKTTVTDTLLATYLGSGSVDVYATPGMAALMEAASVAAIDPLLPQGQASVGIALQVKHLAATPPGEGVRARAEVGGVDGRKVTFEVQAWDEHGLIGEGTHVRYVVDVTRFVEGMQARRRR